jgi:transcriptional regulator with XRE-family HTH domain
MPTVRPIDTSEFPEVGYFAEALKRQRELQEINQVHVAEATGVKANYISGIEHGGVNVTITMMSRIAAALGVPLWQLLLPPDIRQLLYESDVLDIK